MFWPEKKDGVKYTIFVKLENLPGIPTQKLHNCSQPTSHADRNNPQPFANGHQWPLKIACFKPAHYNVVIPTG